MANGKKSFILYADQSHTFNELSDKEAGVLIKHIMRYVNNENPVLESKLLKIAFEPIRLQLKRDLKQWEEQREKRSEAGKKGMENRWSNNKAITKDNSVINAITKITDTVNVTVNDTVTEERKELSFPFPSEKFKNAWDEILTTKKWKKKSSLALQKSLNQLGKYNEETAIVMIDSAIAGEWQGLHEIKGSNLNITKTEINAGSKTGTSEARILKASGW